MKARNQKLDSVQRKQVFFEFNIDASRLYGISSFFIEERLRGDDCPVKK